MNLGFLIRNDRCIGCHACTTACKSENQVPVGVNRTWVKNVEKGVFPDVRRHFQVTRCNHCANPPCVEICPTTAMYQRDDGIVEFDPERCIGCKACLQACPYDAIYVDPESGTAAKCHFCAHRTDLGLEPACVVVCPEHAIVAGDLDDPGSELSRMLGRYETTVRKPEQGTRPKLFYVDGEEAALHPLATERSPASFAWADVVPLHGRRAGGRTPAGDRTGGTGRSPGAPPASAGTAPSGPLRVERGPMAGPVIRNVYDAQHRIPWHWPVPAYLVTKGAGAGAFLVLALAWLQEGFHATSFLVGGLLSLAFTALTAFFLVLDLERPDRFLGVLLRPQWRSWLTRGAWILVAFSLVVGAWWALEAAAWLGWTGPGLAGPLRPWAFGLGAPLALAATVYTAFLFGQAEGRDLWQSPLLPAHLVVQALLAGSAVLLLAWAAGAVGGHVVGDLAATVFFWALLVDLVVALPGELGVSHASEDAATAARNILRGRYRRHFWGGTVVLGHLVPLVLVLLAESPWAVAAAALLALAGLYLYEHAFVLAPQEIPNS